MISKLFLYTIQYNTWIWEELTKELLVAVNVNYDLGLSTKCFNKKENQFLSNLLYDETGIPVRIQKRKDKRYSKIYYALAIPRSRDIKKFFSYLELAPQTSLSLAKQKFPWKFSRKWKKDLV